jgi:hypothetical protein
VGSGPVEEQPDPASSRRETSVLDFIVRHTRLLVTADGDVCEAPLVMSHRELRRRTLPITPWAWRKSRTS